MLFESEAEMQSWMRRELEVVDGLSELLDDAELPEGESEEEKIVLKSYKVCLGALNYNVLISENENISLQKGEVLRPDFLMYSSESEAIVIVELKNISAPTRQAGTELSAYSAEVRAYLPMLAESDVINVLVSTEWPTLLRHYVFNEIVWHQKNLICLKPVEVDGDIKLAIVAPSELIAGGVSLSLNEHHLGGFHLCLYDMGLYGGGPKERLDKHLEQMLTALKYIGAKGTEQRNNGFAFLWKNHREISLAPYMITIVNVAPFQTIERLVQAVGVTEGSILSRIVDICIEYSPAGHGESICAQMDSAIEFLNSFCSAQPEGFLQWPELKDLMLEESELVAFQSWGVFEKLFFDNLKKEYESGNISVASTDAMLGIKTLEEIIDLRHDFFDLSDFRRALDQDLDEDGVLDIF
ncbi:hypothetical protein PS903_01642 [Pseudomonas fluorescens]|nr:hypothetical protein PS903_01642 [Pseudomonas fluorescens]